MLFNGLKIIMTLDLDTEHKKICDLVKQNVDGKDCISCDSQTIPAGIVCDIIDTEDFIDTDVSFELCGRENLPAGIQEKTTDDTTLYPQQVDCSRFYPTCNFKSRKFKNSMLNELIAWTDPEPTHNEKIKTFYDISEDQCLCACKKRGYDKHAKHTEQNACFGIEYTSAERKCTLVAASTDNAYEAWQVFVRGHNNVYEAYRPGHLYQPRTTVDGTQVAKRPIECKCSAKEKIEKNCIDFEKCVNECNADSGCGYIFDGGGDWSRGSFLEKKGTDFIIMNREDNQGDGLHPYQHQSHRVRHAKQKYERCFTSTGELIDECIKAINSGCATKSEWCD